MYSRRILLCGRNRRVRESYFRCAYVGVGSFISSLPRIFPSGLVGYAAGVVVGPVMPYSYCTCEWIDVYHLTLYQKKKLPVAVWVDSPFRTRWVRRGSARHCDDPLIFGTERKTSRLHTYELLPTPSTYVPCLYKHKFFQVHVRSINTPAS